MHCHLSFSLYVRLPLTKRLFLCRMDKHCHQGIELLGCCSIGAAVAALFKRHLADALLVITQASFRLILNLRPIGRWQCLCEFIVHFELVLSLSNWHSTLKSNIDFKCASKSKFSLNNQILISTVPASHVNLKFCCRATSLRCCKKTQYLVMR